MSILSLSTHMMNAILYIIKKIILVIIYYMNTILFVKDIQTHNLILNIKSVFLINAHLANTLSIVKKINI